jgi:hypothetical protein
MRYFCTYFNSGYLDRALVLLESMRYWIPNFTIYVLAFDREVVDFFAQSAWPEVRVLPLDVFEARNADVAQVKAKRTRAEYFFTCTGAWINDILEQYPNIDVLTYLDADLCFFSDVEPVFSILGEHSILIAEHDPALHSPAFSAYGRFNVGLLTFRNSPVGRACVKRWREQCVEWCYDRHEEGKYADQKYLDAWPTDYAGHLVVAPPGINAGPWSLHNGCLKVDSKGSIFINDHPLVVYHFQGVRLFSPLHFYLGYYFSFEPSIVLKILYEPYVRKLAYLDSVYGFGAVAHGRYGVNGFVYKMLTGYWVGRPLMSRIIWILHHYVLRMA